MNAQDLQDFQELFKSLEEAAKEKYSVSGFPIIHKLKTQIKDLRTSQDCLLDELVKLRSQGQRSAPEEEYLQTVSSRVRNLYRWDLTGSHSRDYRMARIVSGRFVKISDVLLTLGNQPDQEDSDPTQEYFREEISRLEAKAEKLQDILDSFLDGNIKKHMDDLEQSNKLLWSRLEAAEKEVKELRSLEQSVIAYKRAVFLKREHRSHGPIDASNLSVEEWNHRLEELSSIKHNAGERMFNLVKYSED